MRARKDRLCSSCGKPFPEPLAYPRTCTACGLTVWANPLPVAVVLVPVRTEAGLGVLTVRRGIEPGKGRLALVGGFIDEHETWQEGAARELMEEVGVPVDPQALRPLWFTSTEPRPNRVLLFSVAPVMEGGALPPFVQNREALERGIVYGTEGLDAHFVFPLHLQAARMWFQQQAQEGPHRYQPI